MSSRSPDAATGDEWVECMAVPPLPEWEPQEVWHSHLDPAVPWTTDAWRASMFPTREAAEEWIAEHGLEARAVEHGFMSRLAPREIAREALNRG